MNIAPVAYRYARSLIELAQDQGGVASVEADMRLVADTCKANRDLVLLLNSPVVKADKKDAILRSVFAGKVSVLTSNFISILVRKGRERMLPHVAEAFSLLYKISMNILVTHVTTATPIDVATRQKLIGLATKRHPDRTIELVEHVDPSLIGGMSIRIGDELLDDSVSRKLVDLRREFSKNPYIPAI